MPTTRQGRAYAATIATTLIILGLISLVRWSTDVGAWVLFILLLILGAIGLFVVVLFVYDWIARPSEAELEKALGMHKFPVKR